MMSTSSVLKEIGPTGDGRLTCKFTKNDDDRVISNNNNSTNKNKYSSTYDTSTNSKNEHPHVSIIDNRLLVDQSSEELQDVHMTRDEKMFSSTLSSNYTDVSVTVEAIPELESQELQVGDHVYQWRSFCGLPYAFQHHGIVLDIIEDEEGKPVRLTIADFSNVETKKMTINSNSKNKNTKEQENIQKDANQLPKFTGIKPSAEIESIGNNPLLRKDEKVIETGTQKRRSQPPSRTSSLSTQRLSLEQEGILRTYTDTDKWHKVHYQASLWKFQVNRSGTVTKAKSDSVGLVLARVSFILQHPDILPQYHVVQANCECVAFWCKTGRWSTLQAGSFLELTAAGQVKSTATLAATAAGTTTQITVPSAGIWGSWFGATTTQSVSWLSLHPMAIPGLACYAVVTVGIPAITYAMARKKWKQTSQRLCDAFWESATENPEVFAECITHWSDRGR